MKSSFTAKSCSLFFKEWYHWSHASNVKVEYKSAMHMTVGSKESGKGRKD